MSHYNQPEVEEITSKRDFSHLDEETLMRKVALFSQYVTPNVNLIYKLCIHYTFSWEDVQDNYIEVLINFFRYIETYDPNRSLQTWLHIVTKRYVNDLNIKNSQFKRSDDVDVEDLAGDLLTDGEESGNSMGMDNYHLLYNDDILRALDSLKPIYREALLLQQAGYKLSEIVEISHKNGNLKTKNIETIKSRLHLAKMQMRNLIDRDGDAR